MVSSRWRVPAALLERSTRLRGLIAPSIGVETIDVNSATELGILIAHGTARFARWTT
ncbi:MAG: hypothetical protein Q7K57_38110 [Burkholderiaceae bacterium]|nr:hypothetical protein [Burkholderiaceae bacterium]MDP3753304.1 hypothetical protein [Polaromonas sp.]